MNDRGEKIVTLARELLRSDMPAPPEPSPSSITLSFKALCFATILTAFGSSALTMYAGETRRPLNRYERVELNALFAYTAHSRSIDEASLRHEVQEKLGVSNLDDITEFDFTIARRYLQNMAR
jgi:hypothetical protein